jgi:hypothetical protein
MFVLYNPSPFIIPSHTSAPAEPIEHMPARIKDILHCPSSIAVKARTEVEPQVYWSRTRLDRQNLALLACLSSIRSNHHHFISTHRSHHVTPVSLAVQLSRAQETRFFADDPEDTSQGIFYKKTIWPHQRPRGFWPNDVEANTAEDIAQCEHIGDICRRPWRVHAVKGGRRWTNMFSHRRQREQAPISTARVGIRTHGGAKALTRLSHHSRASFQAPMPGIQYTGPGSPRQSQAEPAQQLLTIKSKSGTSFCKKNVGEMTCLFEGSPYELPTRVGHDGKKGDSYQRKIEPIHGTLKSTAGTFKYVSLIPRLESVRGAGQEAKRRANPQAVQLVRDISELAGAAQDFIFTLGVNANRRFKAEGVDQRKGDIKAFHQSDKVPNGLVQQLSLLAPTTVFHKGLAGLMTTEAIFLDFLQVLSLGTLTWEGANKLAIELGRRRMAAGEFAVARAVVYSTLFEKVYLSGKIKGMNQTRHHWLFDQDFYVLHAAYHSYQDEYEGSSTYKCQERQLASVYIDPPLDWGNDKDLEEMNHGLHPTQEQIKSHTAFDLLTTFAPFKSEMEWIASWDLAAKDPPLLTQVEAEELDQLLDEGFEDMLLKLDFIPH